MFASSLLSAPTGGVDDSWLWVLPHPCLDYMRDVPVFAFSLNISMFISLRLRRRSGSKARTTKHPWLRPARAKTGRGLAGVEGKVGARSVCSARIRDSLALGVCESFGYCVCVWVHPSVHSHNIVFGLPAGQSAQYLILAFYPYRATAFDQSSD